MRKAAETLDLVSAFEASPNPFMILDDQLRYVAMNEAYLQVTGMRRKDLIGRNMFKVFDGAGMGDVGVLRASLQAVLDTGMPQRTSQVFYPIQHILENGETKILERYWSSSHTPIKDHTGRVTHILHQTQDVTDSVRLRRLVAELEPNAITEAAIDTADEGAYQRAVTIQADNRRLANERAQLLDMFMQAPGFVGILTGSDHVIQMVNQASLMLLGYRDVIGRPFIEAVPELGPQGYKDTLDIVFTTGRPYQARQSPVLLRHPTKDRLETHYLDFMFQPLKEPSGKITGIFVQGHDVTDTVVADQRQKLMIDELNHRVKNTLATVQSIAIQTARSHQDPASFAATFQSRILALSHTHDLLTQSMWEGADLHDIIEHEMEAYGTNRLTLRGPDVELEPAMAVSLGMIFHELATNAAKYGALTPGSGHVDVDWKLSESGARLNLIWQEKDGPHISPPNRRGFGSRLIERNVRHDLSGTVETYFTSGGFKAEFSIPLTKD